MCQSHPDWKGPMFPFILNWSQDIGTLAWWLWSQKNRPALASWLCPLPKDQAVHLVCAFVCAPRPLKCRQKVNSKPWSRSLCI